MPNRCRLVLALVLAVVVVDLTQAQPSTAARDVPAPRCDCQGDPLPPGACARCGSVRWRHAESIQQIVFARHGALAATLGRDRSVRVWRSVNGQPLLRFHAHDREYHALAISPDGRNIALASSDAVKGGQHLIQIHCLQTGAVLRTLTDLRQIAQLLHFQNDQPRLLAVGSDQVCWWDIRTGQMVKSQPRRSSGGMLRLSPDGRWLASVPSEPDDPSIHLWLLESDQLHRLQGHHHPVLGLAFSSDGRWLASGNPYEPIHVWDVRTGKLLRRLGKTTGGPGLAFSFDNRWLAAGTVSGQVQLYEVETGHLVHSFKGYRGWINGLTFTPDGNSLAVVGADARVVYFWETASGKRQAPEPGHLGPVHLLAVSPDGRLLASGGEQRGEECVVRLWDLRTGRGLACFEGMRRRVYSLAAAPDGRWLAVGEEDQPGPTLLDLRDGKPHRLGAGKDDQQRINALAFAPGGGLLASGGTSCTVDLWNLDGAHVGMLRGHQASITALAFSPEGRLLASAGDDRTVRLWEMASGRELRLIGPHEDTVRSLAFTPDGRLLVLGQDGWQGHIHIWDIPTGRLWLRCSPLGQKLFCLALSPDGRSIAVALADHSVRILETATGRERRRYQGHESTVHSVAWTPDGNRLISGSADTTILVWDLAAERASSGMTTPLASRELEQLWGELAAENAGTAYRAMCRLAQHPEQAVEFLRKQLAGWRELPLAAVEQVLADLDHPRYSLREMAAARLARLGEQVEPLLRQRLAQATSLEQRRRLELLLQRLELRTFTTEQLRARRAFEILEWIGTPQVHHVVRRYADEGTDARIGEEARSTLQRLQQRQRE